LLCAAAGVLHVAGRDDPLGILGTFVCLRWGSSILSGPITLQSHGSEALRRYGAGGARAEAAAGFPHVYEVGLPALRSGRFLAPGDENAARARRFAPCHAGRYEPTASQRERDCICPPRRGFPGARRRRPGALAVPGSESITSLSPVG
jgi:hypothetical protein